jgi:arylsulfatase A-like enzyme
MMPKRFGIVHALQARDEGLPAGLPTLPRTLQSAGYQTFAVGKWHIGNGSPPLKSGFDHFYGFLGPEIDYFRHTSRNGKVDWQRDEVTLQEEGYSTQLLADEASRLIENRDVKRPFHLHVAFNAPHFPLAAPPDYVKNYPYLSPAEAVRAAVIEALDDAVGQILNTLDKNGLRDNTLVVFLSDNGADQTGRNTPLRGNKSSVYEGGIRVPCFLRWPQKLAARSYCDQPICAQDIYPTLVHAVNITMRDQAKLDGTSQWSAIENGLEQERECFSIAMNNTALFDGPWKLIEFSTGERSLFHIVNDSEEYQDLAKQEVDTVERLVAKLRDQQLQFPKSPNQARRRPPPRVRQ